MNAPATQLPSWPQGLRQPSAALMRVLDRMPRDICRSFTEDQLLGLDAALDINNQVQHPLNLRVTLFGLVYLVILGGRERRTPERRRVEREQHPLRSPGNVAFLIGISILGLILGGAFRAMVTGG